MTNPTYTLEAAFATTNPLTASPTWTDITAYLRGFSITRGRDHELSATQAGSADIALRNTDRRFDPTYSSGPYYPNVLPMKQIRLRATFAATTYDLFRGYVEDWGQDWKGRPVNASADAECQVHAVDAFKIFSMAQAATPLEVTTDDKAIGYWPLDDGAIGDTLGSVEGTATMTPVAGTSAFKSVAGPMAGGGSGVMSAYVGSSGVGATAAYATTSDLGAEWFLSNGDCTTECWVYPDPGGGSAIYITAMTDGNVNAQLAIQPNAGGIRAQYTVGMGGAPGWSTSALSNGVWHHVVATRQGSTSRYYFDGVYDSSASRSITPRTGSVNNVQVSVNGFVGGAGQTGLAHVSFYNYALSAEQIATHYAATLGRLPPQLSGAAIGALLDSIGWPAGLRTIDAGMSTVELQPSGSILEALQEIAETSERGVFYIDGAGKATFADRQQLDSTLASAASFGDSGTDVPYADLELAYDDHDLWTDVQISGASGETIRATDATAVTSYGLRTLSESTLLTDLNEVAGQASGLLNTYKAPAIRPKSVTLRGTSTSAGSTSSLKEQLSRALTDRVTVNRHPPGGGAVLSVAALIEGVKHSSSGHMAGRLETEFSLVPTPPQSFWLLGDATYGVLDSTTRLGW